MRDRFRDPFRELRCEPACVTNPVLVTHAPNAVRSAEVALAGAALLAVAVSRVDASWRAAQDSGWWFRRPCWS